MLLKLFGGTFYQIQTVYIYLKITYVKFIRRGWEKEKRKRRVETHKSECHVIDDCLEAYAMMPQPPPILHPYICIYLKRYCDISGIVTTSILSYFLVLRVTRVTTRMTKIESMENLKKLLQKSRSSERILSWCSCGIKAEFSSYLGRLPISRTF